MAERLKTVDFEYNNFEQQDQGWEAYFLDSLSNFVSSARKLHQFREELKRRCADLPFDKAQEQHDYQHILLGGVTDSGDFNERSLARMYSVLFGLHLESPSEALSRLHQEMTVNTTIRIEETEFSKFVADSLELAESILQEAAERVGDWTQEFSMDKDESLSSINEDEFYRLVDDSDALMEDFSEFLQRIQMILPNYDTRALFVWTLDKVPRFYLEKAYPDLVRSKDTESNSPEDPFKQYGDYFGLKPVFRPEIDTATDADRRKKREYTVYAYAEGSLGRKLLNLYQLIWNAFDNGVRDSLSVVFTNVPNFKERFKSESNSKLGQIDWEFPEHIETVDTRETGQSDIPAQTRVTVQAEYHIDGFSMPTCEVRRFRWDVKSRNESTRSHYTEDCDIAISQYFNKLSPLLFLLNGLEYELEIDQESAELVQL